MATCTSSLIFNPKTLHPRSTNPTSFAIFSLSTSQKFHAKPISISPLFAFSAKSFDTKFPSRFVRNVSVASDFEQDEDVISDDEGEANFPPDLKLFVGNLPFNCDSAQLAEVFENAGTVEMVEVIYDKVTGRSRGFGFVTMSTIEEVQAAAQQFNGYEIDGRPIRVNFGPPPPRREESFSRGPRSGSFDSPRGGSSYSDSPRGGRSSYSDSPRGGRSSYSDSPRGGSSYSSSPRGGSSYSDNSNRVYVGNLSWGVDDMALQTLFNKQGKVVEAKVVYDRESGRSRGFGFVTYNSSQEVNSAIESLDGADLDGRSIRVSVAGERPPRREY